MRNAGWFRALRPVSAMAALGILLGGCACCGPRHHGDAERAVGYQPSTDPYDDSYTKRSFWLFPADAEPFRRGMRRHIEGQPGLV